jgi:hypothetical protein
VFTTVYDCIVLVVLLLTAMDAPGDTIHETTPAGGAFTPCTRQAQTNPTERHLEQRRIITAVSPMSELIHWDFDARS